MNRITKIIISLLFGVFAAGCGPKYVKRDGKVYHRDWTGGGSYTKTEREVVGADPGSFRVLKTSVSSAKNQYAVDKNRVYWCHLAIDGADVETFKLLDEYYSVDSKHIFRADSLFSTADPQTFRVLTNEYALDSDNVYFQGEILPGADSKTFTTLGHYYAKDKNAVYNSERVLSDVSDPPTFRLLGKPDKPLESWWDIIWKLDDPYDVSYQWACDKDYYYREGRRVEGADYATFAFLDNNGETNYAKDRHYIFYCGKFSADRPFIVGGADVETFKVLNSYRDFAQDKHSYYECGEAISYNEASRRGLIKMK